MGYDIKAEREEKERQAKSTAARQARIDRMNSMKSRLRIFRVIEKAKELLVNLTGKISQEYAKEREISKSTLCRCKDCGREISKKAESCPGCGALLRRKKQNSGCGCGGCLVLCFLVFIFFAGIFGKMLPSFDSKTVLPPAPSNNNTAALTVKPVTSAHPPVATSPNQFQEVRQEKEATRKWYEGGNLHNADLATWKTASYENKLATAADWAIITIRVKNDFNKSGNIDIVKPLAISLVKCIDTATSGVETYVQDKPYEIAVVCSALMGWNVATNQNQAQEVKPEKEGTRKWYEGGNLHNADLATWKTASYENKLATAADLAFATPFVKRVFYQSKNTDAVKSFATFLVECIDKGTDGINTKYKINELANACAILRGWDK